MGSLSKEQMPPKPPPPDLSKPEFDQNSYIGRAMHFFKLTNPLNLLATDAQLNDAKAVVTKFKANKAMPPGHTEAMLWNKKYLVDSAFHPDTGEKMTLIGRMAAQMPMNTLITGAMITFYKTTAQNVFWQWINQTFNAVVNYTNRSGDAKISKSHLLKSYAAAVGGAVGTAVFLNSRARKMKNPMFSRLVPFAAVCAANCINVPMMRSNEISNGTPVFSEKGEPLGISKTAAKWGIAQTVFSRCLMAVPGMTLVPLFTNWAVKNGWFCKFPRLVTPFQLAQVAACVGIATPLACALWPQKAPIHKSSLEAPIQKLCDAKKVTTAYYNKGL